MPLSFLAVEAKREAVSYLALISQGFLSLATRKNAADWSLEFKAMLKHTNFDALLTGAESIKEATLPDLVLLTGSEARSCASATEEPGRPSECVQSNWVTILHSN